MDEKRHEIRLLPALIVISTAALFSSSAWKHAQYRSTAWDLGIFDQAVYLISRGHTPISTIAGFHILGDHGAFVLYPLALLYRIFPDVHWLFAVQALASALGAVPVWHLARQAGLAVRQSNALALVYLFYPLVFNLSLFDFHPDVLALPAMLGAVLAARSRRFGWFIAALVLTMSCKVVFSLTVVAMGLWLVFFEDRKAYGWTAAILGVLWFTGVTGLVIPFFGGERAEISRHLVRYRSLGDSFSGIFRNLFSKPQLFLGALINWKNAIYLVRLFVPITLVLSPRCLSPLLCAIPALAMNLLADSSVQKGLLFQYSLPILPFLLLIAIQTVSRRAWFRSNRTVILWSFAVFLFTADFQDLRLNYRETGPVLDAMQAAVAEVKTRGPVLTTSKMAPHLTHRQVIKLPQEGEEYSDLSRFEYILFDLADPGFGSSGKVTRRMAERLKESSEFSLKFNQNGVILFVRRARDDPYLSGGAVGKSWFSARSGYRSPGGKNSEVKAVSASGEHTKPDATGKKLSVRPLWHFLVSHSKVSISSILIHDRSPHSNRIICLPG